MPAEIPVHRLPLDPTAAYTDVRPWAPLSEAEWNVLGGYLAHMDCGMSFRRPRRGRPPEDVRGRLDAIFRAVTIKAGDGGRAPWSALPEQFGKADTVSRTFRRWARLGLWQKLLEEAAVPGCEPVLRDCLYYICCAFRRAYRLLGVRAMLLAKRLGLYSALPSPPWYLPDPILSETFESLVRQANATRTDLWPTAQRRRLERDLARLGRMVNHRRVQRVLEPA